MTLQYVLLFLHGIDSWGNGIPPTRGSTSHGQGVAICQQYTLRIQFRLNEANILLYGGSLFFSYIVD